MGVWALPKPAIFEKLSKLFCFWEDNLALAKFQCPTDTPLNHNLLMLTFRTERKKQKNKNHCKNAAVFKKYDCICKPGSVVNSYLSWQPVAGTAQCHLLRTRRASV